MESPGVQDLLARLGAALPIRTRAMFGGVGIYSGELFFALILDQRLYFRVDGASRPAYAKRGSEPFQPFPGQSAKGTYWEVPERVLASRAELRRWATDSVRAAKEARHAKRSRKPRASGP